MQLQASSGQDPSQGLTPQPPTWAESMTCCYEYDSGTVPLWMATQDSMVAIELKAQQAPQFPCFLTGDIFPYFLQSILIMVKGSNADIGITTGISERAMGDLLGISWVALNSLGVIALNLFDFSLKVTPGFELCSLILSMFCLNIDSRQFSQLGFEFDPMRRLRFFICSSNSIFIFSSESFVSAPPDFLLGAIAVLGLAVDWEEVLILEMTAELVMVRNHSKSRHCT